MFPAGCPCVRPSVNPSDLNPVSKMVDGKNYKVQSNMSVALNLRCLYSQGSPNPI